MPDCPGLPYSPVARDVRVHPYLSIRAKPDKTRYGEPGQLRLSHGAKSDNVPSAAQCLLFGVLCCGVARCSKLRNLLPDQVHICALLQGLCEVPRVVDPAVPESLTGSLHCDVEDLLPDRTELIEPRSPARNGLVVLPLPEPAPLAKPWQLEGGQVKPL